MLSDFKLSNITLYFVLAIGAGCATLPRNAVPVDHIPNAVISGIPGARAMSGDYNALLETDLMLSVQQAFKHTDASETNAIPAINVLSLSGGGDFGAFGAGFMHGWTLSGTRPEFKLVTGISTGALIAPFAFLGKEYDAILQQAFTTISAKDIFIERWVSFLWNDSFADSTPLAKLIKRYITSEVMLAIAAAHRQGRRLFIGTTNLDADRLVIWNMGVIANSDGAAALNLFQQIILASSSIPGAFPPVMIQVEVGDNTYDEMHVDGGIKAQLFLLAATLNLTEFRNKLGMMVKGGRKSKIFVIRNGAIDPEPRQVARNLAEISERAVSSLINAQASNDLNRVYEIAKTQGLDFNWVALPPGYDTDGHDEFDRDEMNRLFRLGYRMGLELESWRKKPPSFGQQ